MDKLQWFKFTPTDWIMGKIQRCPEVTQARFMRLVCLYWNKECILSYEDAEIEIDKEHLEILISKKILKVIDEFICIDFLNEQLKELECIKDDKSTSAKIGNLKRWHRPVYDKFIKNEITLESAIKIAYQSHPDYTPITPQSQNIAEESRVEESREEKSIKENNIVDRKLKFASTLKPFVDVYGKDLINEFYKYWTEPNKSNTKFKQELEKTWSLERRLETWVKNDKSFNKNQNGKQNLTDTEEFKNLTKAIRSSGAKY